MRFHVHPSSAAAPLIVIFAGAVAVNLAVFESQAGCGHDGVDAAAVARGLVIADRAVGQDQVAESRVEGDLHATSIRVGGVEADMAVVEYGETVFDLDPRIVGVFHLAVNEGGHAGRRFEDDPLPAGSRGLLGEEDRLVLGADGLQLPRPHGIPGHRATVVAHELHLDPRLDDEVVNPDIPVDIVRRAPLVPGRAVDVPARNRCTRLETTGANQQTAGYQNGQNKRFHVHDLLLSGSM